MHHSWLAVLIGLVMFSTSYSWNASGHRLIALIAYHHLSPHARQVCNRYDHALDRVYRRQTFISAATWLDSLRYQNQSWLGQKHYINMPFSWDGTELLQPAASNAVSAIREASKLLQNPHRSDFDKGFSLRILLHVTGDIHQPLHAVSQFSVKHPKGDGGGNLFSLPSNAIASNLHAYWDKGGGFLNNSPNHNSSWLKEKARSIEQRWPCHLEKMELDPQLWARQSFQLAVNKAYSLKPGRKPSIQYQKMTKAISERQIALAGCRLAALLNALA
jgi:hypothetical protein